MADFLFWAAVAACVVAQAAIVRSALHAPSAGRPSADGAAPLRAPPRVIEIGWTVLPAIALAAVLVLTWRAMHPLPPAASPAAPALLQRSR